MNEGDEDEDYLREIGVSSKLSLAVIPSIVVRELTPTTEEKMRNLAMRTRPSWPTIEEAVQVESNIKPMKAIRTGCVGIDQLLDGGFKAGVPLAVVGESGAGKTQFAYQIVALALMMNPRAKAFWIDSKGAFRPERVEEIVSERGGDSSKVLNHIMVRRTVGSTAQRTIAKFLKREIPRNGILVIDDVYSNFEVDFPGLENSMLRYAILRAHLLELAGLTYRSAIFTLIIFPVRFKPDELQVAPAGQTPYFNLPSQLWFRRERGYRYVSYTLRPGKTAKIVISRLGIQDAQ